MESAPKNAGRNSNEGVVLRRSRGSPGQWFPETEYLCASAIFVVGRSGIPPNLNYRSVSPISFLSDRQFRVRIGSTFSNLYNQEERVPLGSILSVTLFNIKINSITMCLTPGIGGYLYVGDFCITSRSKYMRTAERHLQQCINEITQWTNTNGFKISKCKTRCVHFCQLRKMHNDPLIKLEDTEIPVVNEYKFLGVIFDRKLSFISHIKY